MAPYVAPYVAPYLAPWLRTLAGLTSVHRALEQIRDELGGELHLDDLTRQIYSTDASVYQEVPLAVVFPKGKDDIRRLIELACRQQVGLIPRTAGTSLAGQVVGDGIVVDVSRHMNSVVHIDGENRRVTVQPGVIRNELNMMLEPYQMFFAPETSTANRAMIGGMLGNNSCGANSIVYGATRDRVVAVSGFLSDGSYTTLSELSVDEFRSKCGEGAGDPSETSLETSVYRGLREMLSDPLNQGTIRNGLAKAAVRRRNTGYALDAIAQTRPFGDFDAPFNLARLIAGSEGTLFFATEIVLQCDGLPPPVDGLLAAHFTSIDEALRANILAMRYEPSACELMDRLVLEGAARNRTQRGNMEFVDGDPAAILLIGSRGEEAAAVRGHLERIASELQSAELGYHFPIFLGDRTRPVWELRRAGLGVVANIPGNDKPTTVIEDTAVAIEDLPQYIAELDQLLRDRYGAVCVHHAHAGAGELHLRPVLNLKTDEGRRNFRGIAEETAALVKRYQGSLSGEHGDGRLRAEFLRQMVGDRNYQMMVDVKNLFDPHRLFNPGKIIDAPPMDTQLRYDGLKRSVIRTVFDFSTTRDILGAAEMCSGSGDCRKTHLSGGVMCPSYMATRDEKDSTRARANLLRKFLSDPAEVKPLVNQQIRDILDLCLSCKACKAECPSNVDMAKLKAEASQAYHQVHGIPTRTRWIAGVDTANRLNQYFPWLYNVLARGWLVSGVFKRLVGFHPRRSLPKLHTRTLRRWFKRHTPAPQSGTRGTVMIFCDEFTNYFDVRVGIAAVELLERLGYAVEMPAHVQSGRALISKGLLKQARSVAIRNVQCLAPRISKDVVLIGLEPSALLSLRDEYLDLLPRDLQAAGRDLAASSLLLDEFLDERHRAGEIDASCFSDESKQIRLHGHCHQRALGSMATTIRALQIPENYQVKLIPSGCCGMAGSFGYEKEHYQLSMQIGELVLFPTVRELDATVEIAAPGTSCRHQILDGTGAVARHPAEILRQALR